MAYSLCCISNVLKENGISFGSVTKTRFMQLPRKDAVQLASKKALQNITTTFKTIQYCAYLGWNYRVSCNLFPLLSLPQAQLVYEEYPDYIQIEDLFSEITTFVKRTNIRLSNHPDQFVVIASEKPHVVQNSIRELEINAWVMDKLGTQTNYQNPINVHINTSGDCDAISKRFFENFEKCNESVKSRLVLENEDKGTWNVQNIVSFFGKRLPITYDNLHDACNPSDITSETAFQICYNTWGDVKPLFHYSESSPQGTNKRAHASSPTGKPLSYNMNVDWEIELKDKDYAVRKLITSA